MYKVTKDVVETGNFELKDMLKKIDTFWLKGSLSDNQRTELYELAQSKARPENSVDLIAKITELEKKVQNIEARFDSNSNITEITPEEGETIVTNDYPEFVVGKWYYMGDKITFGGSQYICTAPDNTVCVWNPADYPTYWKVIET
jgi:hypothetical protein